QGEVPGEMEERYQVKEEVGAHHEDVPVGKVDQPEDAVDHGVADGDQGVEAPEGDPVEELLNEGLKTHLRPAFCTVGPRLEGGRWPGRFLPGHQSLFPGFTGWPVPAIQAGRRWSCTGTRRPPPAG